MKNAEIKKQLLKEADGRIARQKQASLDKEGMAYMKNQKGYNNSPINLRVYKRETGKKVAQIQAEIEKTFSAFLKERTAALNADFSETGEPQSRATSRTVIVPQLSENPKLKIHLPDDTDTMALQGFPNKAAGGSIYFRWAWKRTILPSNTDQDKPSEEMVKSRSFMDELNDNVDQQFSADQFIQDLEHLRMPLTSYFHTTDLRMPAGPVANHILHHSKQPFAVEGQPIPSPLMSTVQAIRDFDDRKNNPRWQALTLSNRTKNITFSNDELPMFTSHSILLRALFFKIIAGYTLDTEALKRHVIEHVQDYFSKHQVKGKYYYNRDQRDKHRALWQKQYIHMVNMFNKMEARAPKEWKRWKAKEKNKERNVFVMTQPTYEGSAPEAEQYKTINYLGLRMRGKGKGKGQNINPKSYRLDYGKNVPFGAAHLQMILRFTTSRIHQDGTPVQRQPGGPPIDDPNTFTDPTNTLKYSADGISDHTVNEMAAANQKTIALPPMRTLDKNSKFYERDLNRLVREKEILNPEYPVLFDTKDINLGGAHSVKNGPAVSQIVRKYGRWARETWMRLKASQEYFTPEFAEMFNIIDKGFFGAEIFLRNLTKHNSLEEYQKWVNSEKTRKEDESGEIYNPEGRGKNLSQPLEVTPDIFNTMQQYGYWVSKMMDFINALIHRSCASTITVVNSKNNSTQTITRYGQNYSTATGIGGGGEILLSVKYAYNCDVSEFAGTPEAEAALRQAKREVKLPGQLDVVRQPAVYSPDPEKQKQDSISEGIIPQNPPIKYSEDLKFWVGVSSAIAPEDRPDFGTAMFQTAREGTSWTEMLNYLNENFSNLEEETGDILSELNINMKVLSDNVKKVLQKTRDTVKAQGADTGLAVDILYRNSSGEEEILPAAAPQMVSQGPAPAFDEIQQVPPGVTPATGQQELEPAVTQPAVETQPSALDQTETYNFPQNISAPEIPTEQSKLMPMEAPPQYIGKNKSKRQLIRNRSNPLTGKIHPASVIDRLVHVANSFDDRGQQEMANKIDFILKFLKEKNNV